VEPTTISNNSNNNHIPTGAPHISASDSHATEITSPGICCGIVCNSIARIARRTHLACFAVIFRFLQW
jgi:hypothetical protein